jgi:hypothetical protein
MGDLCYKVPNASLSLVNNTFAMDEAEAMCKAEGGNLPSFHNAAEWADFNTIRWIIL